MASFRHCQTCGKYYSPTRRDQRHCSPECERDHARYEADWRQWQANQAQIEAKRRAEGGGKENHDG